MSDVDPGDLDDDLPPLIVEDGQELPVDSSPHVPGGRGQEQLPEPLEQQRHAEQQPRPDNDDEDEELLRATAALRAVAAAQDKARKTAEDEPDAAEAMRRALAEVEDPRTSDQPASPPSEATQRMLAAISRDDFEECEDAILQGADVNVDCGAGMHALHISALRGEMFLTELLIAHSANVNQRDMSGNTPLLYACHFYRQHGKGVQLTAQLLFHRADPFYRVKDGKLAGSTALDLAEQACREPQMDENVPRQMVAMIKLAMESREECHEAITKVWLGFKSQNKKLYQVSSKNDKYDYLMKNVGWVTPADAKNQQTIEPVKIDVQAAPILEEKIVDLKDYLFTDEGDKVKVYVTFPDTVDAAVLQGGESLGTEQALQVAFEFQSFDVQLRTPSGNYRLRIDPLFGSIDAAKCKHRISASSRKVTLTLAKRHSNRSWAALQKAR